MAAKQPTVSPAADGNAPLRLILDANAFPYGRVSLEDLAVLKDLYRLGVKVSIPEPVLNELVAHAMHKFVDVEPFLADDLAGPGNITRIKAVERLRGQLEEVGTSIIEPTNRQYKDALLAQIHSVPPAGKKSDVQTGAVDYIFYRVAVSESRRFPSVVAVSGDRAILTKLEEAEVRCLHSLRAARRVAMDAVQRVAWSELIKKITILRDGTIWKTAVEVAYELKVDFSVDRVVGISDAFVSADGTWIVYAILHSCEVDKRSRNSDAGYSVDRELIAEFNPVANIISDVWFGTFEDSIGYMFPYSGTAEEYINEELMCIPAVIRPHYGRFAKLSPSEDNLVQVEATDEFSVGFVVDGHVVVKVVWSEQMNVVHDDETGTQVVLTQPLVDLRVTTDKDSTSPRWRGGVASALLHELASHRDTNGRTIE
ncbi:hypothetical protein [Nocardia brasiliensis]|uniref:hypothetical protein n=1 Tax=Nocardia brasiliensis TaxID=37326 RepID=UPI001893C6FF|nr:hypothetical protein [Nocardia brasiliensis]MBF6543679.1 hypothetical protein [Nocardia brasiliensis]